MPSLSKITAGIKTGKKDNPSRWLKKLPKQAVVTRSARLAKTKSDWTRDAAPDPSPKALRTKKMKNADRRKSPIRQTRC